MNVFHVGSKTWVCDSPGLLTTVRTKVKSWRWDAGASIAGNKLVLNDAAGESFASATADGANYTDEQLIEGEIDGLSVGQIDAGLVYIKAE